MTSSPQITPKITPVTPIQTSPQRASSASSSSHSNGGDNGFLKFCLPDKVRPAIPIDDDVKRLFCWRCGQLLSKQLQAHPTSRFCAHCGARIVHPPTVTVAATASNNNNTNATDEDDDDDNDQTRGLEHKQPPPSPPPPSSSSVITKTPLSPPSSSDDNDAAAGEDEHLAAEICLKNDSHVMNDDNRVRGRRWVSQLDVQALKARFQPQLYLKLLSSNTTFMKKIRKDIRRTFPDHVFFRTDEIKKRRALENILRAYSVYDSDIGYSQGMAFIAGHLLLHMDEEKAFWAFVRLMYSPKHNLRDIFNGDCDVLPLCLKEFDRVLAKTRPKLYQHLTDEGLDASMYATQWFLTIFIYRFPSSCLPLIWDRFVTIGIVAIFQVGLAILTYFSIDLLQLSSETLIPFFNDLQTQVIPDEIIVMASHIHCDINDFQYIRTYFQPDKPIVHDSRTGRPREVSL